VTGGLRPPRITIAPRLAAGQPDQARALVGHVLGHYVHADQFIVFLLYAALAAAALCGIAAAYRPTARLLGVTEGLGEPEALPVATVLAALALASATLAGGAYLRWANVRADAYALDMSRAPDGLAQGLLAEWDHSAVDPTSIEEALFYTHPPLRRRLTQIEAWRTSHPH
jgi:STE24 endopeptidase